MSLIDQVLIELAPGLARARLANRAAARVLMRYDAASGSDRARSLRPVRGTADVAGAQRGRIAAVVRDMIRNTPFATRAQAVIAANVVGDGIIPKPTGGTAAARKALLKLVQRHFDTTDIDAEGRQTLYGLQRLVVSTMVEAGECLVVRRWQDRGRGLALPFQVQVIEPEYLDTMRDGTLADGQVIRDGIQFGADGQRVGYWLFAEHPGGSWRRFRQESRLVPARDVLHIYRQDRPGQQRGVSWFAPVVLTLADYADIQSAQLMRQKIAACFAAFRYTPEAEFEGVPGDDDAPDGLGSIVPGRIQNLPPGYDIKFASPPPVEGYDDLGQWTMRAAAAGLGITYESLSGDLSRVNFSSARMGRLEMDRNITAWQWQIVVPQLLQPITAWAMEALDVYRAAGLIRLSRTEDLGFDWVPPPRIIVDPAREIPAMRELVQGGYKSRQHVIRELGYDPETVLEEQIEDKKSAETAGLALDGATAPAPKVPVGLKDEMTGEGPDRKDVVDGGE